MHRVVIRSVDRCRLCLPAERGGPGMVEQRARDGKIELLQMGGGVGSGSKYGRNTVGRVRNTAKN